MADQASHSHADDSSEQRISNLLQKGEEMMDIFHQSIRAFESTTLQIDAIQQSIASLQQNGTSSKRQLEDTVPQSNKRCMTEKSGDTDQNSPNVQDELDMLMSTPKLSQDSVFLDDLTSFFAEEAAVGDNISEQLGNIVNRSLRGQCDSEKIKKLREQYKRPANVDNLQVPKVDRGIWEQFSNNTKARDYVQQKALTRFQEGLLPLITAMDHVATTSKPDVQLLRQSITDAFKLLCNSFIQTNKERKESIKKELHPKFHSITEKPSSATGLFGDSVGEELKKLDVKPVNVNITQAQRSPFLGKTVGARLYGRPSSHYNHHNKKHNFRTPQKSAFYRNAKQHNKKNNKRQYKY